jgi:hypothetical protein
LHANLKDRDSKDSSFGMIAAEANRMPGAVRLALYPV